jgi:hypothetical protein
MPKQDVFEICEKAIRKDLGRLDDIPYELANTVANVYYKYFNQALDEMKRAINNPGSIPKEMKRETNMHDGLISFLEKSAKFKADFEAVPKFIEGLREIDKYEQPNLYQAAANFILDCLKYNIKDANKKTELRRTIERKVRRGNVQEIPNLVDFLDL